MGREKFTGEEWAALIAAAQTALLFLPADHHARPHLEAAIAKAAVPGSVIDVTA